MNVKNMHLSKTAGALLETERLVRYLVNDYFEPPPFDWRAFAVEVQGGEPRDGYGASGFFYTAHGQWIAASFNDARSRDHEYEVFMGWITASRSIFGKYWQSALIQVIQGRDALDARVEYEFLDMERWRAGSDDLGDIIRPPELPAPIGSGLLRRL